VRRCPGTTDAGIPLSLSERAHPSIYTAGWRTPAELTGAVAIKALMLDVDGVLVDGRPEDGRHWLASVQDDFGFTSDTLHEQFFVPYWEDIVLGRAGLMQHLTSALQTMAPHVSPARFVSYWFQRDSRVVAALLPELSWARAEGIRVYLATNQEHLRAAYLMENLRLADHVDGIFYSARLGARKPDMEFFARVQAAVGLCGEEMLLIDDSRQNIDAALRAGWRALHWTNESSPNLVRSSCR
jgi:putative hydrolase of the HAD superfamily